MAVELHVKLESKSVARTAKVVCGHMYAISDKGKIGHFSDFTQSLSMNPVGKVIAPLLWGVAPFHVFSPDIWQLPNIL